MLLYGQTTPAAAPMGGFSPLIMLAVIFVMFYLLLILPSKKRQKQHAALLASLKGGERIITAGGIYGTVTRVLDDRIEIQADTNTRLQVAKTSIATVIPIGESDIKK